MNSTTGSIRGFFRSGLFLVGGIVKLTHHKLKKPQDMGSKPAPKYSI